MGACGNWTDAQSEQPAGTFGGKRRQRRQEASGLWAAGVPHLETHQPEQPKICARPARERRGSPSETLCTRSVLLPTLRAASS